PLGERFGWDVTRCHDPTGCAKGNPIAHRLFGPIRIHWSGTPLRSFARMLSCIRGTPTPTGRQVSAVLLSQVFATGPRVTNAVLKTLPLPLHSVCPRCN